MRWQKTQPELPFPDRRQHRRYLTKRNVLGTIGILILLFTVITIRSEMRNTPSDEFGRVYGKQLKKLPEVTAKPMPVITEAAPVPEAPSADPFSLDAAAREQFLGDTTLAPSTDVQTSTLAPASAVPPVRAGASDVRVQGGPEGVVIVRDQEKHAPVLGGGFGRP